MHGGRSGGPKLCCDTKQMGPLCSVHLLAKGQGLMPELHSPLQNRHQKGVTLQGKPEPLAEVKS